MLNGDYVSKEYLELDFYLEQTIEISTSVCIKLKLMQIFKVYSKWNRIGCP